MIGKHFQLPLEKAAELFPETIRAPTNVDMIVRLPPGEWGHIDFRTADAVAKTMAEDFAPDIRWFVQGQRHNHQLGVTEVSNTQYTLPGLRITYNVNNAKETVVVELYPSPELLKKFKPGGDMLLIFYSKHKIAAIDVEAVKRWMETGEDFDLAYQKDLTESNWNGAISLDPNKDVYGYYSKHQSCSMKLAKGRQLAMTSLGFDLIESGEYKGMYSVAGKTRYYFTNLSDSLFKGAFTQTTYTNKRGITDLGPATDDVGDAITPPSQWPIVPPLFNGAEDTFYLNGDQFDFVKKSDGTIEIERSQYATNCAWSRVDADSRMYGGITFGNAFDHKTKPPTYPPPGVRIVDIRTASMNINASEVEPYYTTADTYTASIDHTDDGAIWTYTSDGFTPPTTIYSDAYWPRFYTFFTDTQEGDSVDNTITRDIYNVTNPSGPAYTHNGSIIKASAKMSLMVSVSSAEKGLDIIRNLPLEATYNLDWNYFEKTSVVKTEVVNTKLRWGEFSVSFTYQKGKLNALNDCWIYTLNFPPVPDVNHPWKMVQYTYGSYTGYTEGVLDPLSGKTYIYSPYEAPIEYPSSNQVWDIPVPVTYDFFGLAYASNGDISFRAVYVTYDREYPEYELDMYMYANDVNITEKITSLLKIAGREIDSFIIGVKMKEIKMLA